MEVDPGTPLAHARATRITTHYPALRSGDQSPGGAEERSCRRQQCAQDTPRRALRCLVRATWLRIARDVAFGAPLGRGGVQVIGDRRGRHVETLGDLAVRQTLPTQASNLGSALVGRQTTVAGAVSHSKEGISGASGPPPAPSITTPRIRSLPRLAHRSRTQSGGCWSFSAPRHGSLAFSSTVSSPSVRGRAGDQPEIEQSSASRSSHKPDTSGPSSFPRADQALQLPVRPTLGRERAAPRRQPQSAKCHAASDRLAMRTPRALTRAGFLLILGQPRRGGTGPNVRLTERPIDFAHPACVGSCVVTSR